MKPIDYMKDGVTVKTRNGSIMMKINNKLVSYNDGFLWFDEDNYNYENLTDLDGMPEYDIMEIHDVHYGSFEGWSKEPLTVPLWKRDESLQPENFLPKSPNSGRPIQLTIEQAKRLFCIGDKVSWYGQGRGTDALSWIGEIVGKGRDGIAVEFEADFMGHCGHRDLNYNSIEAKSPSENMWYIRYEDRHLRLLV